jgi:Holliday junction resolvase
MTESKVQKKKIDELEAQGYYVIKLISTNKNGIPDLLALKKGCVPWFIEVKKKNGKASELQKYRIKELKKHGFIAEIFVGD